MDRRECKKYYESAEFEAEYLYEGNDLGVVYTRDSSGFKLWSPLADQVTLHFYETGDAPCKSSIPMEREERGVWFHVEQGDCHGLFYDFTVEIEGKVMRTADPYAKACNCNGTRSMVVDLSRTNPEGWEEDCAPVSGPEQIITEIHVKDFSFDPASGVPKEYRGKYKAFTLRGTTLHGQGKQPTCLDYLKKLGVTHVQLMPVFDFGSVDEAGDDKEYNWGYDPLNYNVPEGSYSTDPFSGEVRIRELKELVMALHQSGIRVIIDVVYNHTYSLDSWFSKTVPHYYYRQYANGKYADGSACGNDIASERYMCGKYILESVLYWAREYHMDGFRFDLMGLLDVRLMNRIQEELDKEFGEGEILIYGEPWRASHSPMGKGSIPCLGENIKKIHPSIGVFSDRTRDAIKGHVFYDEVPGFVNGGKGQEKKIMHSVRAWTDGSSSFCAGSPRQIITYVSAHDNLTLWDKLMVTLKPGQSFLAHEEEVLRANRMAAAVYFTCQGRIFFLSGEEGARTKLGDDNSFQSSPELNRLDWERVYEYEDLLEYYRGLIAFRKKMPGLYDKSEDAGARISDGRIAAEGCLWFCVDNRGCELWDELCIGYNSTKKVQEMELPQGEWELLVDENNSWHWNAPEADINETKKQKIEKKTGESRRKVMTGKADISPVSVKIFGKRKYSEKAMADEKGDKII